MILIKDVILEIDADESAVKRELCRILKVKADNLKNVKLHKMSVDARRKDKIRKVASYFVEIDVELKNLPSNTEYVEQVEYKFPKAATGCKTPVIVVGSGPAGLFAAYTLTNAGVDVVLLERGAEIEKRVKAVEHFNKTGELDLTANIQFGEGGAGTFSDGKLTTGIKESKCGFVKETFFKFGAPEDILYSANAHIGTDYLRKVVVNMRKDLAKTVDIRFQTLLDDIAIENGKICGTYIRNGNDSSFFETQNVILATGHSARDTYEMLIKHDISMRPKAFSIGARIEHRREDIDRAQYGASGLTAASYKLATHLDNGRGVYTFCMCPGGKVVAAASEKGGVVVNGMSDYARDGKNSNSAVLVSVTPDDFGNDCRKGIEFQRKYEHAAFLLGGGDYKAPVQLAGDFLKGRMSSSFGKVEPTYPRGVKFAELRECLPEYASDAICQALPIFDRKINGFAAYDAVLTGVETRSSSPVQIARDEQGMTSVYGLFAAGEGAGYAGGIMSAAVDGIVSAEKVIARINQI